MNLTDLYAILKDQEVRLKRIEKFIPKDHGVEPTRKKKKSIRSKFYRTQILNSNKTDK